jgi:myo-inositol 2-dehydrogenase/D-chiro-inositol 1-dehydrogenase
MSELRVGFAGAGFIAGIHAQTLAQQRGMVISAVFDPDGARSDEFASQYDSKSVPSYEAVLEAADAVYVCTPNALHADMAVQALQAGKHVFSEKPTATTLEDARRVRAAAEGAAGVYQIGFNKHFAPVYAELRQRLASGDLRPHWASIKMNRGELHTPSWVADASLTGGFLYETPIHVLELSEWLFGPVQEVYCRARQTVADHLDDFAMVLTFASGMSATLTTSAHTTWLFPYERLEVYGEHATAVTEEMERVTFQLGLEREPVTIDVSDRPIPERWGYAAADIAFLDAARGDAAPVIGAAEGERAVRLVDACYRSAEAGTPIGLA